jgi:hypothetical protein
MRPRSPLPTPVGSAQRIYAQRVERQGDESRPSKVKRLGLFAVVCSSVLIMTACTSPSATSAQAAGATTDLVTPSSGSSISQPARPDPVCQNAPPPAGHVTIADQDAADAAYDRVRHLIQTYHLVGYSSGYVNSKARQAHIYWVGPVPAVLRNLPPGRDRGTVVFHSAPYTSEELKSAMDHVMGTRLGATDPSGYVISSVDECVDGTGIRVEVADPRNGDTPPKVIPPSLIAKIKTLAGSMPAVVVSGYIVHPL